MVSARCFASALRSNLATDYLPSPSYEISKTRKRKSSVSEDDFDDKGCDTTSSIGEADAISSVAPGRKAFDEGAIVQYEISGLPLHRNLPASNFPHAFRHRPANSALPISHSRLSDKLAKLCPPLYAAEGSGDNVVKAKSSTNGLRQQHLVAMTALLQKCVLEGDFIRAGRAWGMLLRAERDGISFDLRTNGQWGLGAEIILRRETQLTQNKGEAKRNLNTHGIGDHHQRPGEFFSCQGFEKAKEYYERLVLQYPYRKAFPNTTGPQDFYIAMFSLWIYSVEEQRSLALNEIEKGATNGERTHATTSDQDSNDSVPDMERHQYQWGETVRKTTLHRANEIAIRLEELVISPPFSDNIRFTQLKVMVGAWTKDLSGADDGLIIIKKAGSTMREYSSISNGLD